MLLQTYSLLNIISYRIQSHACRTGAIKWLVSVHFRCKEHTEEVIYMVSHVKMSDKCCRVTRSNKSQNGISSVNSGFFFRISIPLRLYFRRRETLCFPPTSACSSLSLKLSPFISDISIENYCGAKISPRSPPCTSIVTETLPCYKIPVCVAIHWVCRNESRCVNVMEARQTM
jgi:hypothetical protein